MKWVRILNGQQMLQNHQRSIKIKKITQRTFVQRNTEGSLVWCQFPHYKLSTTCLSLVRITKDPTAIQNDSLNTLFSKSVTERMNAPHFTPPKHSAVDCAHRETQLSPIKPDIKGTWENVKQCIHLFWSNVFIKNRFCVLTCKMGLFLLLVK